jgi:methylated-DNA-protein-cysteine methyltransferase-like protein
MDDGVMPTTDARSRIVAAVRALPRGHVASYGQVAARAGLPGRARLVARVLAEAPTTLRLPWHRVLRSDGRIAFPPESRGHAEQVRRLRAEGVRVTGGRVAAADFAGASSLDAALWGPDRAAR